MSCSQYVALSTNSYDNRNETLKNKYLLIHLLITTINLFNANLGNILFLKNNCILQNEKHLVKTVVLFYIFASLSIEYIWILLPASVFSHSNITCHVPSGKLQCSVFILL